MTFGASSAFTALAELSKSENAVLRIRSGRATLRLSAICTRKRDIYLASFTARQRDGETIETMMWRALIEFRKREIEGNPKPRPEEAQRRQQRRILRDAPETRPM